MMPKMIAGIATAVANKGIPLFQLKPESFIFFLQTLHNVDVSSIGTIIHDVIIFLPIFHFGVVAEWLNAVS